MHELINHKNSKNVYHISSNNLVVDQLQMFLSNRILIFINNI